MSVFLCGGSKSGKSMLAQRLAAGMGHPLYYVATMVPRDAEDEARVRRHRLERSGWGFETLECPRDVLRCLEGTDPAGAFLLDSATALLANGMFDGRGVHPQAYLKIAGELSEFIRRAPNSVIVSDYIFSDALLYDELTEAYRRGLAHIHRRLADCCDTVVEAVAGRTIVHKGELPI